MAFEDVLDFDCGGNSTALGGFNKKTNKDNPTTAEGYYLGTRQVPSKKSKSGFSNLHILKTPTGNLGVWGKTHLDGLMKRITPGVKIRIQYAGLQETDNNPMYKYQIRQNLEDVIDVSSLADPQATGATDDLTDADVYQNPGHHTDDTDLDTDVEASTVDEPPVARAVAPRAAAPAPTTASQARTQAMLKDLRRNKSA